MTRSLAALLAVFALWAATAFAGVDEDFLEAAKRGDLVTTRDLIAKGANVNAKVNEAGRTALILATERGYIEIVKLLLDKGVDVNTRYNAGQTALMIASYQGYIEIVRALIAKGADVNARDFLGDTPTTLAAEKNHEEVYRFLISKGGNF